MNKDYLFVIPPSDTVLLQVSHCKLKAADIIGQYRGMHTKAHLTVHYILNANSLIVETALPAIKGKIEILPRATIGVNGFNYFQQGNNMTIYAAIKGSYQTDNWFHELTKCFGSCKMHVPHITITRNITANEFYRLWPQFKQLTYQDTFVADRILVFEKDTLEEGKGYRQMDTLYFKNG